LEQRGDEELTSDRPPGEFAQLVLAPRVQVRSTLPVPAFCRANRRAATLPRVVAAVMLTQWIFLLAFSTSERLHQCFCDGSQQPNHDCALVSVAKGQLLSNWDIIRPLIPWRGENFHTTVQVERFVASTDYWLMPDRGPPSLPIPT
jgi:hypothetical protein